jgi:hypothetical protein
MTSEMAMPKRRWLEPMVYGPHALSTIAGLSGGVSLGNLRKSVISL